MTDRPRDYDQEWTARTGPDSRLRVGYSHERGQVTRFVVQLEYRLGDDWTMVIRADHDETRAMGHDVSEDGVHIDVYRSGSKHRTEEIFPPTPAGQALTLAEEHLTQHAQRYIERFVEWHRTDRGSR